MSDSGYLGGASVRGTRVAHQVFLSHATEDRETAAHVCALLEAEGISCWMAPRDVAPGTDYAAAIVQGIRDSELVVVVFSAHANTSPYVLRELDRAVAYTTQLWSNLPSPLALLYSSAP